jgi:hypothetical protein
MKILITYPTLPTYLINKPNNLGFALLCTTNDDFISYCVHI